MGGLTGVPARPAPPPTLPKSPAEYGLFDTPSDLRNGTIMVTAGMPGPVEIEMTLAKGARDGSLCDNASQLGRAAL